MSNAQKIALLALLLLYAILPLFLKNYGIYLMTLLCVYLMAAFGLNLIVGYAGQMSIGQAAFYGIGAYQAAILLKIGWPFFVVLAPSASPTSRGRHFLATPSTVRCRFSTSPWCR